MVNRGGHLLVSGHRTTARRAAGRRIGDPGAAGPPSGAVQRAAAARGANVPFALLRNTNAAVVRRKFSEAWPFNAKHASVREKRI
jgi:hypothetical protein